MMNITNQERICRAFAILKNQLEPHVIEALEKADGKNWNRRTQDALRKDDPFYGSSNDPVHLDIAALLFIIWNRWQDCFASPYKFTYTHRSYVSELREARNMWAHQIDFDDDTAARTIETARLLIKSFGGLNNQELLDLRQEITASPVPIIAPNAKQEAPRRKTEEHVMKPTLSSPRASINRIDYISRVSEHLGMKLLKKSQSGYSTQDGCCRIICMVSKLYNPSGEDRYWFSFYPNQKEFLDEANHSWVAIGCGSIDNILMIPSATFAPLLDLLNVTTIARGTYWHIHIIDSNGHMQLILKGGDRVDVTEYRI